MGTMYALAERSYSQAEHAGLILKATNGTTIIGSPTADTDGGATTIVLPGGQTLMVWVSTIFARMATEFGQATGPKTLGFERHE